MLTSYLKVPVICCLLLAVQVYTEEPQKSNPLESPDTVGLITSGKLYVQIVQFNWVIR